MRRFKKIMLLLLLILNAFLIGCVSASAPSVSYSAFDIEGKKSIKDAHNSINESVKDMEEITKIKLTNSEFISYYNDGQAIITSFEDMKEPKLMDASFGYYAVRFGEFNSQRTILFKNEISARKFASALSYLKNNYTQKGGGKTERGPEDCLRQVRNTSIDLILAGATARDLNLSCSDVPQDQIEAILNDILVEWKSKGLRVLLQKSTAVQLNDLVVKMEKGILKLDLKAKQLKDVADENARQVKAPGEAAAATKAPDSLTVSHLLDQRKTLLMVILGSVKQVAAQRAAAGN